MGGIVSKEIFHFFFPNKFMRKTGNEFTSRVGRCGKEERIQLLSITFLFIWGSLISCVAC